MGKGYNNYMCKKPFHPGSKANIKRAWMAEQKTENEKKKQEDLKAQYEKEQNLYNNRALISSDSKEKLQLNFMYEAPPGAKRERQKEDDEPEFKFEWQRKYNAPREDYAKGNEDIKDQPFGIPVRNVRCIKCHKWGHINTDKECPLFNQASTSSMPTTSMDPMELMRQMKEDGFGLKEHVLGHQLNPAAANQQFIPSDEESDPEMDFLKSLSSAEKKKLLKKLKKLSKKQKKSSNCKKKKSKKTKKSKSKASSSSESETEKKSKKKKSKKSSTSETDTSSDESEKRQNKKYQNIPSKEKHYETEKKQSGSNTKSKELSSDIGRRTNHQSKEKQKHYKEMHDKDANANKSTPKERISNKDMKREKSPMSKNSSKEGISYKKIKIEEQDKSNVEHKHEKRDIKNSKSLTDLKTEKKRKTSFSGSEEEKPQDIRTETCKDDHGFPSPKRKHVKSISGDSSDDSNSNKNKYDHPDGFSHLCPQVHVKENYIQPTDEYKGNIHDRFRLKHREIRSPSVKQKYNK